MLPARFGLPGVAQGRRPAAVRTAAASLGVTPVQVGLAWHLAHYSRTLLIAGTTDPAHLAENIAAGEVRLDAAMRAAIDDIAVSTP